MPPSYSDSHCRELTEEWKPKAGAGTNFLQQINLSGGPLGTERRKGNAFRCSEPFQVQYKCVPYCTKKGTMKWHRNRNRQNEFRGMFMAVQSSTSVQGRSREMQGIATTRGLFVLCFLFCFFGTAGHEMPRKGSGPFIGAAWWREEGREGKGGREERAPWDGRKVPCFKA